MMGAPLRALARPAGPQPKFYLASNPSWPIQTV
jgi:hypothetical protein